MTTWSWNDLCGDCDPPHRRGAHTYDAPGTTGLDRAACTVKGCRCRQFRIPETRYGRRATPEEMEIYTAAFEKAQAEYREANP